MTTPTTPTATTPEAATLGDLLQAARKDKGLTQAQVSEKSGITQGHISQLEKGERTPGLTTLRRLRDALEVDEATFMAWVESA